MAGKLKATKAKVKTQRGVVVAAWTSSVLASQKATRLTSEERVRSRLATEYTLTGERQHLLGVMRSDSDAAARALATARFGDRPMWLNRRRNRVFRKIKV